MSKYAIIRTSYSTEVSEAPNFVLVEVDHYLNIVSRYLPLIKDNNIWGVMPKDIAYPLYYGVPGELGTMPDSYLKFNGLDDGLAFEEESSFFDDLDDIEERWNMQDFHVVLSEGCIEVFTLFRQKHSDESFWFRVEFNPDTLEIKSYLALLEELPEPTTK